jgi:hypothetical protein
MARIEAAAAMPGRARPVQLGGKRPARPEAVRDEGGGAWAHCGQTHAVVKLAVVKLVVVKLAVVKIAVVKIAVVKLAVVKIAVVKIAVVKLAVVKLAVVKLAVVKLAVVKHRERSNTGSGQTQGAVKHRQWSS